MKDKFFRRRKNLFPRLKKKFVKLKQLNFKNSSFMYDNFFEDMYLYVFNINTYIFRSFNLIYYKRIVVQFKANKVYFYDKNFKKKFYDVFLYANVKRGFSNLFFFYLLKQYSSFYRPFAFNLDLYKKYIFNVLNLPDVNSQFVSKKPKQHDLEEMPLKNKFKRLRVLEGGTRSLLYGYKFHFVGRFTRKQKAASL